MGWGWTPGLNQNLLFWYKFDKNYEKQAKIGVMS